jgi:hypothetical protein
MNFVLGSVLGNPSSGMIISGAGQGRIAGSLFYVDEIRRFLQNFLDRATANAKEPHRQRRWGMVKGALF